MHRPPTIHPATPVHTLDRNSQSAALTARCDGPRHDADKRVLSQSAGRGRATRISPARAKRERTPCVCVCDCCFSVRAACLCVDASFSLALSLSLTVSLASTSTHRRRDRRHSPSSRATIDEVGSSSSVATEPKHKEIHIVTRARKDDPHTHAPRVHTVSVCRVVSFPVCRGWLWSFDSRPQQRLHRKRRSVRCSVCLGALSRLCVCAVRIGLGHSSVLSTLSSPLSRRLAVYYRLAVAARVESAVHYFIRSFVRCVVASSRLSQLLAKLALVETNKVRDSVCVPYCHVGHKIAVTASVIKQFRKLHTAKPLNPELVRGKP